jgi:hypothetical protein
MNDEALKNITSASEEPTSSNSTALTTINAEDLNKESLELINQIIAEADIEKTKDLTYLFNINQNKKTMIRVDKLSGLQDNLVDQLVRRISERPDEISNKELMDGLKIVQDIIERGQKQVAGVTETPLIQINQQTNSVNIGDTSTTLSRESRDKVKNAVTALLGNLMNSPKTQTVPKEEIIEVEVNENDN